MVWAGVTAAVGGAAKETSRCCKGIVTICCIPCQVLWRAYVVFVLYILPFLVAVVVLQKTREAFLAVTEVVGVWANLTRLEPEL